MSDLSQYRQLGMRPDDCYRNIPEQKIIRMITLMGSAFDADSPEADQASRKALQGWVDLGLEFRQDQNGERLFDPVETQNFLKWAAFQGRDNYWSDVLVPYRGKLMHKFGKPGRPESSALGPKRFSIDFMRTFNVRSVPPGSKLRLKMPLPLTSKYLYDLEVTPRAGSPKAEHLTVGEGRLELKIVKGEEPEITFGAKIDFTCCPQEPVGVTSSEEPDGKLYLSDREGLIVVSARVRALAASLSRDGAAPLESVRAYWNFINDKFMCSILHYDQIEAASPCDWILDLGWFDCHLGAVLLAALCRARGIPSRIVFGCLLRAAGTTPHYWAEAWIAGRGWMPFDFLAWDFARRECDREWRDTFFGRVDYRMVCELRPRQILGALGVPVPPAWYLFCEPTTGGSKISFMDIAGTPVYFDTILREA